MNPSAAQDPSIFPKPLSAKPEKWGEALESAGGVEEWIAEGIGPIAHRALSGKLIGEEDRAKLQSEYYRSLSRNIELLDALEEIDRAAAGEALTILALKGAALAEEVYGDPGLRPMSDLDLLVKPTDEPGARAVLSSLGYTTAGLYQDLYRRGRVVVDLHTDAINRSRIRMRGRALHLVTDELFERSGPLASYRAVVAPHPIDHLLILCIHAFKHGYRRRIWLFDIAEVASRLTPEECEDVSSRFDSAGAMDIVGLSQWIVERRLGYRLPLEQAECSSLNLPLWLLRLSESEDLPQILEPVVTCQLLSGRSDRIRYLVEIAFPRRPVLAQISGLSGRWTFWLSYPLRCVQLAGMVLRCAFTLITPDRTSRVQRLS